MSFASSSTFSTKFRDLQLDLNLDQATADKAWENYESISLRYTLDGEQLPWLSCALYAACRLRSIPTVGRPGNVIQGNCVSLTRMLQYCGIRYVEFLQKMKLWVDMCQFDEGFCQSIGLLERNFAVSNNIFKKYKPIFLDLFKDPALDPPRPQRSRKQRRPPCNSRELFTFGWSLYILIKGKYRNIPQDLVSCYSLLLSCVDLLYTNVLLSRKQELFNPNCRGLPQGLLERDSTDLSSWPDSILLYLCNQFEGITLDTMEVRDYHWKPNIKDLVEKNILKGTHEGTGLLDQNNFDHNCKEIKNSYEEYLLNCGEIDERMFFSEDDIVRTAPGAAPSPRDVAVEIPNEASLRQAKKNLNQQFNMDGDHHLILQTPITGRSYTVDRPTVADSPVTVITSGLQKLYTLIAGREAAPSEKLLEIFSRMPENPEETLEAIIKELGDNFCELFTQSTQDYSGPDERCAKLRLQMGQMLYYTFLEHILIDESKRNVDLWGVLRNQMFHKALFTCCLEIVLVSYNDPRKFPWSLQVGNVKPYDFIKIIEPVIRSEKQSNNQLSRELVKHLKWIEERILDSLAWKSNSPLWEALKSSEEGVPMCQEVNYSDQLENDLASPNPLQSPKHISNHSYPQESPVSTLSERFQSPLAPASSARKMLFQTSTNGISNQNNQTINVTVSSPKTEFVLAKTQSSNEAIISELPFTSPPDPNKKKKEKPKRGGSMSLFFRKFYTLANMRLGDLCTKLAITEPGFRRKMWTCFEHSIVNYRELMKDRHMDQMIMCAIYIMFKVTKTERNFQEIMKEYRSQPQAASHIYRSVLISRTSHNSQQSQLSVNTKSRETPPTPSQVTGTSINFEGGERGDLIKFYNAVYVQDLQGFALKFSPKIRPNHEGDEPPLSPLPVTRQTPCSPRRRVSANHPVFINSLTKKLSPMEADTPMSSQPKNLPYTFNRSPAKMLNTINSRVSQSKQLKRCLDLSVKSPKRSRLLNDRLSTPIEMQQENDCLE